MPDTHSDKAVAALEEELDELALRREWQQDSTERLAGDIRDMVSRAQGHMSMSEVARRLGIDRSTLYRVYLNGA